MSPEQVLREVNQYLTIVDALVGVYLDATTGFRMFRERFEQIQSHAIASANRDDATASTLDDLDAKRLLFGEGGPDSPDAKILHITTQKHLKEHNEIDGINSLLVAEACVVTIYQHWEDHHRARLATAPGLRTKNDVKISIMSDIRLLRQAIIHHRSVAHRVITKSTILRWFQPGEEVNLTKERFRHVVVELRRGLTDWTSRAVGRPIFDHSGLLF